jgi:hypothetical protein
MDDRFDTQNDRVERRFDTLQNSMIVTLGAILAAFAALYAAAQF